MKEKIEQMKKLIEEIAVHNHNYYDLDKPTISDAEYDKLFPPKEAVSGTETQKKFETMVKKVRPYRA